MAKDNKNQVEKLTMTIDSVAKALGISRATAYSLANQGRLPVIRISDRRFIVPVKALNDLLDSASKK
jgi:excisionase family DNA binding protein